MCIWLLMQYRAWPLVQSMSARIDHQPLEVSASSNFVQIPVDAADVWEVDPRLLKFEQKLASGSFGDLYVQEVNCSSFSYFYVTELFGVPSIRYHGTYCSQDVAIKVLKPERVSVDMLREFAQEVYIMKWVMSFNILGLKKWCNSTLYKIQHFRMMFHYFFMTAQTNWIHYNDFAFKN